MSDATALTPDAVMARRFELGDEIAIIAGRHKAELAPLNEELELCEQFIKAHMLETGAQQFKTAAGHMAFFTTKDSVKVDDMPAVIGHIVDAAREQPLEGVEPTVMQRVLDHVKSYGLWTLLNNAVNKTAAKELIEANKAPPGVSYSAYKDLSWRRGKAA